MALRLLYFAWVRERVGRASETLEPPVGIGTVGELIAWLKTRGPEYQAAFEREAVVRAAIDQSHAGHSASIRGAREVAFFPPVTGG